MISGVIKAKEERDIMTCYIPNAYVQAFLPKKKPTEDRAVMKFTGVLADILRTSRGAGEPKEGSIC
jgi:hypothetical protein